MRTQEAWRSRWPVARRDTIWQASWYRVLGLLIRLPSRFVKAPMALHRDNDPQESEVRAELVARVRRQIQDGSYETPEKLEIALRRLFAELTEEDEDAAWSFRQPRRPR